MAGLVGECTVGGIVGFIRGSILGMECCINSGYIDSEGYNTTNTFAGGICGESSFGGQFGNPTLAGGVAISGVGGLMAVRAALGNPITYDDLCDEAKALEARGYKKTPWGAGSYTQGSKGIEKDAVTEARWSSEFMIGYSDADYAAKKAPIYLVPMNETTCTTTGLQNGYGFRSSMK